MIKDELIIEVNKVEESTRYLGGYGKPATKGFQFHAAYGDYTTLRSANVSLPGNLPLGTRLKITIEQVDEVTPAIINRGALPEIRDDKLIEAGAEKV